MLDCTHKRAQQLKVLRFEATLKKCLGDVEVSALKVADDDGEVLVISGQVYLNRKRQEGGKEGKRRREKKGIQEQEKRDRRKW